MNLGEGINHEHSQTLSPFRVVAKQMAHTSDLSLETNFGPISIVFYRVRLVSVIRPWRRRPLGLIIINGLLIAATAVESYYFIY